MRNATGKTAAEWISGKGPGTHEWFQVFVQRMTAVSIATAHFKAQEQAFTATCSPCLWCCIYSINGLLQAFSASVILSTRDGGSQPSNYPDNVFDNEALGGYMWLTISDDPVWTLSCHCFSLFREMQASLHCWLCR